MTSAKRLRSVIQSTAHHAVSGLCYVHPHLGKICMESNINSVNLNLLESGFEPELKKITKELGLSSSALREKFFEILRKENIEKSEVYEASIAFNFFNDEWPSSCYIKAKTKEGIEAETAVDSIGNRAEILHGNS